MKYSQNESNRKGLNHSEISRFSLDYNILVQHLNLNNKTLEEVKQFDNWNTMRRAVPNSKDNAQIFAKNTVSVRNSQNMINKFNRSRREARDTL